MSHASSTVRAARLHRHGEPLTVETVELPSPGEDEARVELRFAGVNPVDRYVADGRVAPDSALPRTLGGEAAGVREGHPVLVAGEALGAARDGVWAEAAVVPSAAIIPLPEGVELREAAAMGIAGLTAWNTVRELAQVRGDDRVLVLGGPGGVGSIIISLCRAAGATVWAQTGSQEKSGICEEQGADRVIVAGPEQLAETIAELQPTVVFDPLGDGFVAPTIESLTAHGRLVSFGTSAGPDVRLNMQSLYRKSISLLGYGGMQLGREERRKGLEAALEALRDGSLKVRIDEVLPLDGVNEAFERLVQRRVEGKVLLALSE